jgi:hypothetical protein
MITFNAAHLLATFLLAVPVAAPSSGVPADLGAMTYQQLPGCWVGQVGEGTAQRRAILRVDRRSAGWTGALHVLNRSMSSDSVVGVEATGRDFVVRVATSGGERMLRGKLDGGGQLSGGLETGVASGSVVPFRFTAVRSSEDEARKLVGYWSGTLTQVPFRCGSGCGGGRRHAARLT